MIDNKEEGVFYLLGLKGLFLQVFERKCIFPMFEEPIRDRFSAFVDKHSSNRVNGSVGHAEDRQLSFISLDKRINVSLEKNRRSCPFSQLFDYEGNVFILRPDENYSPIPIHPFYLRRYFVPSKKSSDFSERYGFNFDTSFLRKTGHCAFEGRMELQIFSWKTAFNGSPQPEKSSETDSDLLFGRILQCYLNHTDPLALPKVLACYPVQGKNQKRLRLDEWIVSSTKPFQIVKKKGKEFERWQS